jgi:hypothetical protein
MLPVVVPNAFDASLPIEATETDAVAPVAPTDAWVPLPVSAPTVTPGTMSGPLVVPDTFWTVAVFAFVWEIVPIELADVKSELMEFTDTEATAPVPVTDAEEPLPLNVTAVPGEAMTPMLVTEEELVIGFVAPPCTTLPTVWPV